ILREAFHVKLIDNCVGVVMRIVAPLPIEHWAPRRQHAQRGFAGIWPFPHCRLAVKLRRKEYAFSVWVEENLLRIEGVNVRNRLTRNRVSVITSLPHFAEGDAALPK